MKFKHLLAVFGILTTLYAFTIDDPHLELFKKKIFNPYDRFYTLKRERVYIHFNKSEYLAGDNIWFKAYVYDPAQNLPFIETNKLYAELFNTNGKLIERKTIFIVNGTGNSFFNLSDTLQSGTYTVRAYTNWMRNFTDQPLFTKEFTVLSSNEKPSQEISAQPIDIQFFAEGGSFIADIDNRMGIKATAPNGHGIETLGSILNNKGDTIQHFNTNKNGLGDFVLHPISGEHYKAIVNYYKNKTLETKLPEPELKGIGLSVNTFLPNKVFIDLRSGQAVTDSLFYVLIHNNGVVYNTFYIQLKNKQGTVVLKKSDLGTGLNCITIFNSDFKPVAERLVFTRQKSIKGKVNIKQHVERDSIQFEVNTADTSGRPIESSLSISVLPGATMANNFNSSLLSDVLLGSGIKGNIENSNYYFESDDYTHQKALDDLLLTQGWRKYDWPKIMETVPMERFSFETGFSIRGKAENWLKGKADKNTRISLVSPKNGLIQLMDVDDNGEFAFNGLYLTDSTQVMVSAASQKGSSWNRKITANIAYPRLDSSITVKPSVFYAPNNSQHITYKPLTARSIGLKEVVVREKKIRDPFAGNIYKSMADKTFTITKENYNKYLSLEDMLRQEFFLQVNRSPTGELSVTNGRGASSFSGSQPMAVILDGMIMSDQSYLSLLNINDIEAVSVNKSGSAMLGLNGGNGSINIVTRKSGIDWGPSNAPTSFKNFLVKGYAKPTAYFTPKYILPVESETYQKYATIFWKPDVLTDSTGKATFKFAIPKEIKEITIRTEGISRNGSIYLDDRKVQVGREM